MAPSRPEHDYVAPSPHGLTLADLNGDSHLDLVVANVYYDTVTVYFGSGAGTFATGLATRPGPNLSKWRSVT